MTRYSEEFNESHTHYHSIALYDMVQNSLALTFSFIIMGKIYAHFLYIFGDGYPCGTSILGKAF